MPNKARSIKPVVNGNIEAERTVLPPNGVVTLHSSWLANDGTWLNHLRQSLTWEQRELTLFGRRVLQPRLIAWFGDQPYRYSNDTLKPRRFPTELRQLLRVLTKQCATPYNHVLLNLYEDGKHHMGFHSDNEPELGMNPPIASLSLGARRTFTIKPKKGTSGAQHRYFLGHGDLLVMSGALQQHYLHGVPKAARVDGPRLNLTFRHVLGAAT